MATAKVVCGDCGAVLSGDDRFCPQCGTRVEEHIDAARSGSGRCGACGNEVAANANFCESCGAALKGSSGPRKQASKKNAKTERERDKKSLSFEPWQVLTGGIVLLLVAFFAYTELTREQPISRPPAQANPSLPDAAMMQEIDQLQRAVDANPKDDASLIRLANMLHDAAMHNPMLLTRAINTYSRYLALKPTDPNARVDMGICYFEMGRIDSANTASLFSRAIQEMETALKVNPAHQPAAFNLGIVNLNAGNMQESSKWFKKAMEIDASSTLGKKAKEMLEQHSFQGSPN